MGIENEYKKRITDPISVPIASGYVFYDTVLLSGRRIQYILLQHC